MKRGWKHWLSSGLTALLATPAFANPERWQLNMTPGVTATSQDAYQLHMLILWICVVIGIIVFGAIFYSTWKFRKSKGAVAANWSHNTTAELVWTVIPVLILLAMAFPATRTLVKMADTGGAEITVKITGYQWKWRYEFLGEDVNFVSSLTAATNEARQLNSGIDPHTVENYLLDVDRRLVLPTNTKIRFVITADDVIHAWWVPALGWKQDAIPGFINEAWTEINEPGVYRGQCAELCGKDHGFMPIVVEAVPRAQFDTWLGEQKLAQATPAAPLPAPAAVPAATDTAAPPAVPDAVPVPAVTPVGTDALPDPAAPVDTAAPADANAAPADATAPAEPTVEPTAEPAATPPQNS